MAWNEPGNNGKNNDPWKQGGRDQGPPDLDEVFRNLGKKLGGVFGGKGGGSGNAGSGGSSILMIVVLIVAIAVWALSGFYTIKDAERGVILRFGQYHEEVGAGIHWKPTFIDTVTPVNTQEVRSLRADGFMLTQDQNLVRVTFEVQYRIFNARQYLFSVVDADSSLREATDAALRFVIGHSIMDDVLTRGREVVRQDTRIELESIINPYNMGLTLVDVNFRDARPPEEVRDAFDDAIKAQEDQERFVQEATAYAREIEPRARGQVNRVMQEAEAYKQQIVLRAQGEVSRFEQLLPQYLAAPKVTRDRMYLETMEYVYSNTSKILVDVKNSNNLMYLPLDKLMNQGAAATQGKAVTPLPARNSQDMSTAPVFPETSRASSPRTGSGR
ncbi:MAG: FtsH protease activity modulator HflK [Alishewanella sp.]|uniref:FtsH protease activity modulator HflK n=1 Tax=Gammaproteobacteria TaxID=1236 RepID=UPI001E4FA5EF|nr:MULTISPECIES: FtsH protease activity modulator HflK [unclassified Rheinheimera]MCC5451346.1 FtsH protease activity modulator HflK [Rheinheimera sp. UJ51]MCF4008313.1 FtsH protease activity modulator HflK [Rheinheimera sp. UJ63]MDP5036799.1 FtsH protease activity modulator HflK [Alishewanella sp.]MDP5188134.1 FtsH protease activity modulator HflK [Alishewanella sp.]